MKPLKSGLTFASWLLRISVAVLLVVLFLDTIKSPEFGNIAHYVNFVFILTGVLIFVGGFLAKPTITVLSGMLLSGLSIYRIIIQFSGEITSTIAILFIVLSIGFFFACSGNQH